ncbi:sugar phosphate isomerase/epimerase [Muricomes sp. OA1]|uniref:Sugar phosphate isomerase/epimerase n=1 Tax=Hungatella hathewayi TaxID=154046 RepID=A0A3E2WX44_9FIRM|nr:MULTISPECIES: TIM barrel protein [Clostridia]MCH1973359.1 sugar phosphate isomerase/epimerase [Muricomes sp. OA1]RGC31610.1 sugar phosphate isomerase/epimerase [Hungatella hathewayi]GKH32213.1 AP endonuclease [Faecalicatena contorta]
MSYRLGINLGFAINKYIEPEVWSKIVAEELELRYVQFVADLLNPFLPETYVESQIKRIKDAVKFYDIRVESLFTSAFTRVNHFMHPDEEARKIWLEWFKSYLRIGSELGAKNCGSHFGILTFHDYEDPDRREFIIEEAVKGWQTLSFYAKELGYECLIFEPMSVPREMANTIADTKELMDRVNANCGVPMKVCLDIGHAPDPKERDPYPWIQALAGVSPVIHLQQTVLNKSNHAPFTEENNRTGIIKAEKVMECVKQAGCKDSLFAFEISHREHYDTEFRIIQDLKESVKYWKPYITNQEVAV